MLTDDIIKDKNKLEARIQDWIQHAEDEFAKVDREYTEARKYFEHEQAPAGVPANKEYIEENLITDLVYRLQGQLIGGRFQPVLIGGGNYAKPMRELFLDILDKNKFKEKIIENISNYYSVEGFCGLKLNFNPFKRSVYGFGFPEIWVIRPDGSILLDPNSIDPYHEDDIYRIHKVSIPLEEAKQRFPDFKDKIVQSFDDKRSAFAEDQFINLYELQFKRNVILNYEEFEEFFIVRSINNLALVKPPNQNDFVTKHRWNRFTIIPVIHTPRITNYKYPLGPVAKMKDTQDQLNIASSVINEAVKASIKMQAIVAGVKEDEQAMIRRQMADPNGIAFLKNPNAKITPMFSQPLVRPVVEYHQMIRHRFDEISGKFAPDRGEVSGDLSGRAISLLQYRGMEPEIVNKSHIEYALCQLGYGIMECIVNKMKNPFNITKMVEGQEKKIYYNTPESEAPDLDEDDVYNYINEGNYINQMENANINDMELKVQVEMNLQQQKEFEMNKAILMRNGGNLALEDYLKVMYPDSWKEKLDNISKENQAVQLVNMFKEAPPELLDEAMNQMKTFIQIKKEYNL